MARLTDNAYPLLTAVSAGDLFMVVDVDNFAENPAGTTSKITAGNLISALVIPPSGDATGVTDLANINGALAAGRAVQLLQATVSAPYWINAPITPVSQSRLWGAQWWGASSQDLYSGGGIGGSGGSLIKLTSTFTGNAGINMVNGTGTQYYGVDIAGITIDGSALTSGTVYGLYADGAWGACFLRGVCLFRPPADCMRTNSNGTTGAVPDDWFVSGCKFSGSRNGYGVYCGNLPDSWFVDCESSEHALDAWYIGWSDNTRFTSCKGENSGHAGFHLAGISNISRKVMLTACSTQFNNQDGFFFDDDYDNKNGTYVVTGCTSRDDNQSASTYAGFRANACGAKVLGTGCWANGSAYGIYEGGASYGMYFTGSYFAGTTAATHDDGTNTNPLANMVPAFTRTLGTGISAGVFALTDAATIALDASKGNDFYVTLGGNRTLGLPSNPVDRQVIRVDVIQPASGGPWTLSYNAVYDFGSSSAPTLSTAANKVDTLAFRYVASISKWTYIGSGLGF